MKHPVNTSITTLTIAIISGLDYAEKVKQNLQEKFQKEYLEFQKYEKSRILQENALAENNLKIKLQKDQKERQEQIKLQEEVQNRIKAEAVSLNIVPLSGNPTELQNKYRNYGNSDNIVDSVEKPKPTELEKYSSGPVIDRSNKPFNQTVQLPAYTPTAPSYSSISVQF